MPIVEQSGINWAKETDDKETEVEYNEEDGFKRVIEYRTEDEKQYKITNIFRIDKIKMSKSVAHRKELPKFGDSENDPAGVNSKTTIVSDEVFMQFLNTNKEEENKVELATSQVPLTVKCRFCRGDHWSAKCPHKDLLQDKIEAREREASAAAGAAAGGAAVGGKYVPPSQRAGASMSTVKGKFDPKGPLNKEGDEFTVRVTNLPEDATEVDLMELFKPFGKVNRIFLAKDKNTQQSRGFAFVNFQNKMDAQKAIYGVNDYGYSHLILKVEWAKQSNN